MRYGHKRPFPFVICLLLLAVACTISPPAVKVEVSGGGPVAAQEGQTTTEVAPGEQTSATGEQAPIPNVAANSAQALARASAACVPQEVNEPGVTTKEIKLGSTFARSGPVANISGPIEQGVRSYFRAINEAGGICKRKINLVGYDDGWNPQEGKRLIQKLVEDEKVFALAVVPSSLGLEAATEYLAEKGVPAIGTSGLIEKQFQVELQWPVGASTGLSSPHVSVPFLTKERGVTKYAGFYVSDLEVGRLAAAAIEDEVAKHGALLCAPLEARRLSDTEYSAGFARILDQSQRNCGGPPEFLFFALDPSGVIRAAKQASWRPSKGWGGGPPTFLDLIPQQVGPGLSSGNTVFVAQSPYLPPIPPFTALEGVQAYVKTVQKYYGTGIDLKNPYLEGGYCGAALVAEGIRRAGPAPTRAKLVAALDGLSGWSCGVSLPLNYSKGNHYGNRSFVAVRLEFQGNGWSWKPDTCTSPGDNCWRTDQKVGCYPPAALTSKYGAARPSNAKEC